MKLPILGMNSSHRRQANAEATSRDAKSQLGLLTEEAGESNLYHAPNKTTRCASGQLIDLFITGEKHRYDRKAKTLTTTKLWNAFHLSGLTPPGTGTPLAHSVGHCSPTTAPRIPFSPANLMNSGGSYRCNWSRCYLFFNDRVYNKNPQSCSRPNQKRLE